MSDQSPPSLAAGTVDETADRRQLVTVASVASLVVAMGVGLASSYWLPVLVLACSFLLVWIATACSPPSSRVDEDGSENGRPFAGNGSRFVRLTKWKTALFAFFVLIAVAALLARWVEPIRWLLSLCSFGFLVTFLSTLLLAAREKSPAVRGQWTTCSAVGLVCAAFAWLIAPPAYASVHPVFHTPVSGKSIARPAVLVELLDDTEHGGLGTAELYLSVQSSRFPSDVQVILPVNRGSFRGCKYRFVQLPFEVEDGDTLALDLVDDNELTPEQEQLVLEACRAGGFCIQVGGAIVQPELDWIVRPTAAAAAEVVGKGVVLTFRDSPFRNFGRATYIVQHDRPRFPHEANPVTLLDGSNYSRATVKMYFPSSSLSFDATNQSARHGPSPKAEQSAGTASRQHSDR